VEKHYDDEQTDYVWEGRGCTKVLSQLVPSRSCLFKRIRFSTTNYNVIPVTLPRNDGSGAIYLYTLAEIAAGGELIVFSVPTPDDVVFRW
jgi:hypothetical protein